MVFKESELGYLEFLCSDIKTSIDIGANHGIYLERLIPLSRRTIGFEPNPELFVELISKFSPEAEIMPYALSNKEIETELKIPLYNDSGNYYYIRGMGSLNNKILNNKHFSSYKSIKIKTKTLDNFNYDNVGFIKIDVEGHEIEVIEGAMKTISEQKPNMIIEIEERHREGAIKHIYSLMKNMDYDVFFIYNNTPHHISDFDIEKHQNIPLKAADYKPIEIPNYVNNFIFVQDKKILL